MPLKYAVIPAAGAGKRITSYAKKIPKPMIQVHGKPILAYVLERCKRAGLSKIILVVNPHSDVVEEYFGDGSKFGVSIEYITQAQPEGIGHAVSITEGTVKPPFAVYLGDEMYWGSDHRGFIKSYDNSQSSAVIGLMRVDNKALIRRNYSVDIDPGTNTIRNLVEKPVVISNNILGCGSYIFDDAVFDAIHRTPRSLKKEIEITDAINTLIETGKNVRGFFLGGTYLNINYPKDINRAEKLIQKSSLGKSFS